MKRTPIRALIRNLLAASVPFAGCSSSSLPGSSDAAGPPDAASADQAVSQTSDLAVSGPVDMLCVPPVNDPNSCSETLYPDGGVPAMPTQEQCKSLCPSQMMGRQVLSCYRIEDACGVGVNCMFCAIGRRPPSLPSRDDAHDHDACDPLGHFFARAAELEAASIDAFEILARELSALGAPASLVERAIAAAADERRHARVTAKLAERFGGMAALPRCPEIPLRSGLALALDNAIEGCVRETFGAVIATHQAGAASDRAIRRAMRRIATDETRHAELSWAISGWLEPTLDEASQHQVDRARRAAAVALIEEASAPLHESLVERAGLPHAAHARDLAARFAAAIDADRVAA